MTLALRFCAALIIAVLCVPALSWLTLICADFAGFDDCLSPHPVWVTFSVVSACALTLPPALLLWPDTELDIRDLLREGLRSVLFSFSLFAIIFLAGARPFFAWLSVPAPMTSAAAAALAPVMACPLACISYTIIRFLVPYLLPEYPAPLPMRIFGWLGIALAAFIFFLPWFTGGSTLIFPGRLWLIGMATLVLLLRHALFVHGATGFIPLWGTISMLCAFQIGRAFPYLTPTELSLSAVLLLMVVGSCFCLLHRKNRYWFV